MSRANLDDSAALAAFFALSDDLCSVLAPDGRILDVNAAWETQLGWEPSMLRQINVLDLLHPRDRATLQNALPQMATLTNGAATQGQALPSLTLQCRAQDGAYRALTWRLKVLPQTHKILALAQVNLSQADGATMAALNQQLVDAIDEYSIYLLDPEGRIRTWNPGAERISGFSEAEMLGQSLAQFYTPEDQAQGKLQQELAIAAREGSYEAEGWRTRRDGSYFWVRAVTTVMRDADGQPTGFVRVVRDITECHLNEMALKMSHQELEQRVAARTQELETKNAQLEAAHQELQQLNATLSAEAERLSEAMAALQQTQVQLIQAEKMSSLGQLVAGIAHEINNPVNFIYGNLDHAGHYIEDLLHLIQTYATALPTEPPAIAETKAAIDLDFLLEDLPRLLKSMKVGADRIRQIVLSLRNFSRLDEAAKKAVDIHEGLESTLLILHNRVKARPDHPGIQIVKDYGDLPPVDCYASQLNQVFMNLLSNAIDALEEHGTHDGSPATIRIETRRVEAAGQAAIAIRITDNGPGIPPAVQASLFEPFFTTKPAGKGTGLGLSISQQIVAKHAGELHCHSTPGHGTTFVVTMPQSASDS